MNCLPFIPLRLLLKHVQGTDAFLGCWTLVESGMYIIAACLIGLRPLLTLASQWVKKRSIRIGRRTPTPETVSTANHQNERDSMSRVLRGHNSDAMRTQPLWHNLDLGRSESSGGMRIHVP